MSAIGRAWIVAGICGTWGLATAAGAAGNPGAPEAVGPQGVAPGGDPFPREERYRCRKCGKDVPAREVEFAYTRSIPPQEISSHKGCGGQVVRTPAPPAAPEPAFLDARVTLPEGVAGAPRPFPEILALLKKDAGLKYLAAADVLEKAKPVTLRNVGYWCKACDRTLSESEIAPRGVDGGPANQGVAREVYFCRTHGVNVSELSPRSARDLLEDAFAQAGLSWSLTEDGVVAVKGGGGNPDLVREDALQEIESLFAGRPADEVARLKARIKLVVDARVSRFLPLPEHASQFNGPNVLLANVRVLRGTLPKGAAEGGDLPILTSSSGTFWRPSEKLAVGMQGRFFLGFEGGLDGGSARLFHFQPAAAGEGRQKRP